MRLLQLYLKNTQTCKTMEEEWKHPALTAGLLFGVAKAYSIAQGADVPLTSRA